MSDNTLDTNIDNYSVDDILQMLNLDNTPNETTEYQVKDAANNIIVKMKNEGNTTIATFFEKALEKVLQNLFNDTTADDDYNEDAENEQYDETTQLGNWWKNEYPSQTNQTQTDKYTDRKQRVQIFQDKDGHFQMKQERLGINQSYPIPIVQDTLNPTLKNKITRIISVDSQYRQTILPYSNNDINSPSFNTDYTFNLSETLSKVVSLKLYSIQLPTTWYTFDTLLGNTCFDCSGHSINIESGNYDLSGLIQELNTQLASCDISVNVLGNTLNKKLNFINNSINSTTITFYKEGGLDCSGNQCGLSPKVNQNLGWNLGFRQEPDSSGNVSITIEQSNNKTADVAPNLYGSTYFLLVVDDFNHNHLNNGLVNMKDTQTKLSLPNYYNSAAKDADNNPTINCSQKIPFMTQGFPRTLTQAQLYSVNEILSNRNKMSNRVTGPTTSDVLAFIPLRGISQLQAQGEPYVEFSPTLQVNERIYFGPVDIERLRVRLIDDKGNVVNLHGHDWSFTLMVEQLYQY